MKKSGNWWFPDHERHLLDWLAVQKARVVINGRESYQGKKQLAAMDLVPANRRRVAIDVGAHVGLWSYNLGEWFDRVEAFEPVPEHRECFRKNIWVEEHDGTVDDVLQGDPFILYPFALGDKPGMATIVTEKGSSGNSMIDLKGKATVEVRTLDSFAFENVDFIKIDTEGFELFVLKGAEQTIKTWEPVIVVEQKRDHSRLHFGVPPLSAVKLLESWGYKTASEISGDYFMVHP